MPDTRTVDSLLAANERFYRTFEMLDFPALAALWEESDRTFCVHPGWPPLWGARPVLESWQRIIAHTAEIRFTLTAARGHIAGGLGLVTVVENITNREGHERQTSGAVSSNLFAFDAAAGLWKLFHHHASPAPVPESGHGEGPLLV